MNTQKSLIINNLNVSYGKKQIIRNAGFSLKSGEFTALLGLNGSGKTTLMRGICGLKKASSGSCSWEGVNILELNEKQRANLISYIPQRHSIVYNTPVIDVVMMGFNASMHFFQSPGKKHRQKASQVLQKLGIEALTDDNFLHLSEGQKQLVILARALIQNAPILLLDEPDSALDFVNRNLVLSKIRDTIHLEGKCGLITMHDPNFALQYCDRLLLMYDGHIQDEIYLNSDSSVIKDKLSRIYGDIDIVEYKDSYVLLKSPHNSEKG